MKTSLRFVRVLGYFVASMIVIITVLFSSGWVQALAPAEAVAAGSVSVWWPTDGASVGNLQPFKALIDGMSADSYSMFWQVDGGQMNAMQTDDTDSPHKEALVDLSGWNWSPSGTYQVSFIAKDQNGAVIGEKQITIHAGTAPAGSTTTGSSVSSAPAPQSVIPVAPVITTPPPPQISETVWWPKDGGTIAGSQPFKARLEGVQMSDYTMYWQVDGGQLNQMADTFTSEGAHKEAAVDVSGWSWHGNGPYTINFLAEDHMGKVISQQSVNVNVGNAAPVTTQPVVTPSVSTPVPSSDQSRSSDDSQPSEQSQQPLASVSGNPLSGLTLYVDPNSNAANQFKTWSSSDPKDAALIAKISSQPAAKWLGDWNTDILSDTRSYVSTAATAGQVPVIIAYDIPDRDCGGYSSGGASSAAAYALWISNLAAGIGSNKAVVILEPDSLAGMDCLPTADATLRYEMIGNAVKLLKANKNTIVYLDAGNPDWISATDMASRLTKAGIAQADGFSLNVSNYYTTADNVTYGQAISALIGGKHFVVDTSRNGLGPVGSQWCNPTGRALGIRDTTSTGDPLVDAFLWLKNPGESDGACNGGPSAGVWWPEQALGLAERAAF